MLLLGKSIREITGKYPFSGSAVHRHFTAHTRTAYVALQEEQNARVITISTEIEEALLSMLRAFINLWKKDENKATNSMKFYSGEIRRLSQALRQVLDIRMKLSDLDEVQRMQVEMDQLVVRIAEAVRDYPEARASILRIVESD